MSLAAHMTRKRNNACLVWVYKPLETGVAALGYFNLCSDTGCDTVTKQLDGLNDCLDHISCDRQR